MADHALQQIAADRVPPQPWRNGGGATRALFAWPPPTAHGPASAAADDWLLRLSLADIGADGPFSAFPGVTRWFTVVEGPGVALDAPGLSAALAPDSAPLRFDGALAPMARLRGGPTRDLNLMLRGIAGGLWRALPGEAWTPPHRWAGLFCAEPVWLTLGDTPARHLPAFSLLHGWPGAATPWRITRGDGSACADRTTPPREAAAGSPRAWWLSADLPAPPR